MNPTPISQILNLSGKTAIVTGGAAGIGYGIAYRLAEAGANVMIADIHETNLQTATAAITASGWQAAAIKTDVAQEADVQRLIHHTVETFGTVDILVNNAGIYPSRLMLDMTTADFDTVLNVNLRSVFLCTQQAAKQMIAQGHGGKIINITSIDALHPSAVGLAHYDASKHGVWGFTKNIALELAPHQIWVNAVAPGGIITPGVQSAQQAVQMPAGVDMKKMLESFLAKIPMKRMGEPDEIGKVVLFLASDLSSYMTGSQIVVDGGVLLG